MMMTIYTTYFLFVIPANDKIKKCNFKYYFINDNIELRRIK